MTEASSSGYSGAPLRKKLGVNPTQSTWRLAMPDAVAAKVPTDITEDTIRTLALPMGYVDTKVCAIDATWSGLKLVIRVSHRG